MMEVYVMKALVILGSPRPNMNTDTLLNETIKLSAIAKCKGREDNIKPVKI